jgi:hypothetical protein
MPALLEQYVTYEQMINYGETTSPARFVYTDEYPAYNYLEKAICDCHR